MKRFFRPFSSGAASVVLAVATLFSYVMGLGRDLMLSYFFGASMEVDAYNTAFLFPDLIFNFTIAGLIASALLPVFRKTYREGREQGERLAGSFILISQIFVILISGLSYVFMPDLVPAIFKDAIGPEQAMIIEISRVLLLSPIIFGLSNTIGAFLMSFKHYLSYALSPALYNLGIILGMILWHEKMGIYSAVYGVVIGLVLHFAVRLFDVVSIKEFTFKWRGWDPQVWYIFKLGAPRMLGLMLIQFNFWIYTTVGHSLVEGSIAAFNYARNLQSFAVSMFGISVATAVFPFLVDLKEDAKLDDLRRKIEKTFLQILVFTVPAAVGLAILDTETVTFLFGRGEFGNDAILLTSSILFYYSLSIPFDSLTHLLNRVFYAFHDTIVPVVANMLLLTSSIVGSVYFAHMYGAKVFAISFFVGNVLQVLVMTIFVSKYIKLSWSFLISQTLRVLLSSTVMAVVVAEMNNVVGLAFVIKYVVLVVVGVLVYAVCGALLGLHEHANVDIWLKKIFRVK